MEERMEELKAANQDASEIMMNREYIVGYF